MERWVVLVVRWATCHVREGCRNTHFIKSRSRERQPALHESNDGPAERIEPVVPGPVYDATRPQSHEMAAPLWPDPNSPVQRWTRSLLEGVQDVIIVVLCVVLLLIMARALWDLGIGAVDPHVNVRDLLSQVLFVTLLIELYRLLIIYLREHRVAIDTVVEIALVASLREVILIGVTGLPWERLVAITAFVLALGGLLRYAAIRTAEPGDPEYGEMAKVPWRRRKPQGT